MGVVSTGILSFQQEQRILDFTQRSHQVARQISAFPGMKEYLLAHSEAFDENEAQRVLLNFVDGDAFIHEVSLLDSFGKMKLRVEQALDTDDTSPIRRSSPAVHEIIDTGIPSYKEESGEYFVPLSDEDSRWGVVRFRWRQDAMRQQLGSLRTVLLYTTALVSLLVCIFVYIAIQQTYSKQIGRLGRSIRSLSGREPSQRLAVHGYSSEFTDISVYLNRILRDVEEEKKKGHVLDDTLRQVERNYIQTRKQLETRNKEFDAMRNEMRDGIRELLESVWCGVVLLDGDYRMHFGNEPSERLLRFVEREGNRITDPTLRSVLAPLVEAASVDRVDDLCAWPQPGSGRSVSCRVRAARIPTSDGFPLFYLIVKDETGYPHAATSAHFSERMVLDVLNRHSGEDDETCLSNYATQQRMQDCLGRIAQLHEWEQAPLKGVSQIHLRNWLGDCLFDDSVRICPDDGDVLLQVNEKAMKELVHSLHRLVGNVCLNSASQPATRLRVSTDPKASPVLEWIIASIHRHDVSRIQSAIEDRSETQLFLDDATPLNSLETDISISMLRQLKRSLHLSFEYVYSENKKLFTMRIVFPREAARKQGTPIQAGGAAPDVVSSLLRNYLNHS